MTGRTRPCGDGPASARSRSVPSSGRRAGLPAVELLSESGAGKVCRLSRLSLRDRRRPDADAARERVGLIRGLAAGTPFASSPSRRDGDPARVLSRRQRTPLRGLESKRNCPATSHRGNAADRRYSTLAPRRPRCRPIPRSGATRPLPVATAAAGTFPVRVATRRDRLASAHGTALIAGLAEPVAIAVAAHAIVAVT